VGGGRGRADRGARKGAHGPAPKWGPADGPMQAVWLGSGPIRKEFFSFQWKPT
jgi:hypothetical protein